MELSLSLSANPESHGGIISRDGKLFTFGEYSTSLSS
jgi:hypothetical protein